MRPALEASDSWPGERARARHQWPARWPWAPGSHSPCRPGARSTHLRPPPMPLPGPPRLTVPWSKPNLAVLCPSAGARRWAGRAALPQPPGARAHARLSPTAQGPKVIHPPLPQPRRARANCRSLRRRGFGGRSAAACTPACRVQWAAGPLTAAPGTAADGAVLGTRSPARALPLARLSFASGTAAGGGVPRAAARAARGARPNSASGTAVRGGARKMAARPPR